MGVDMIHFTLIVVSAVLLGQVESTEIAANASQLNLSDQRYLAEWAEHCIIINGHVWSAETLSDREPSTRRLKAQVNEDLYDYARHGGYRGRGFVDPYSLKNAPNFVRLLDRRTASTTEEVVMIELTEAIASIPGAEVRAGRVSQILGEGSAICFTGQEQWLVTGIDTAGLASDDFVRVVARHIGTYTFTTVMGAARTIHKYEKVPLPFDTEARKATVDDLYQDMVKRSEFSFPIYRPKWSPQSSPVYRTSKSSVGAGMSRTSRSVSTRGTYVWEWNCVERRIRPAPKSN